ncbi:hypothetical protein I6A60_30885 [Frankia sp. AgB1.9]|uniref:hypothetical protein n=1 Tax=unclassified Frankia TaxID=2632575 RepID=UPI001934B668|nr:MULTISPECIES: hypothetical protein [unclassified Frankia]MBL7490808.1 hypothetical protein [Frankia sp. AgW1.1]MBL7552235.1 hypothetical protein [Frankia sp. AgB1.9]
MEEFAARMLADLPRKDRRAKSEQLYPRASCVDSSELRRVVSPAELRWDAELVDLLRSARSGGGHGRVEPSGRCGDRAARGRRPDFDPPAYGRRRPRALVEATGLFDVAAA